MNGFPLVSFINPLDISLPSAFPLVIPMPASCICAFLFFFLDLHKLLSVFYLVFSFPWERCQVLRARVVLLHTSLFWMKEARDLLAKEEENACLLST